MTPDTCTKLLQGQEFFIRTWGDRSLPPMLLLHGFPEYGGSWGDLAPYLAKHFHLIAPDQRGFGQSWAPKGTEHYRASALVADMAELIADYGPMTVLGHDWGAAVAYGLAMGRPDLVSRLIIMNGVHPAPFQAALAAGGAQSKASQYINFLRAEGSEQILARDNFAKMMEIFSAHMDTRWLTPDRQAEYIAQWSRPGRLEAMVNWYRASPLRVAEPGHPITDLKPLPRTQMTIHAPHLLIWGENDTALLPEATHDLEAFAADLTRVDLPDTDHWLHHQNPQAVARIILDWLQR
jgi:pimeloyl-ACP methyl ester carboxylesterase